MKKLPIVATIADAYRFAFGHLGAIIGLIWLPMVLATLLNFLPALSGGSADPNTNPAAAGAGAFEGIAILVLTQLLYAVMYVAITRQALGLRQGPAVIHFALGPPEFRMFGATLLFLLVCFGGALLFGLVLVALATIAATGGGSALSDLFAAAVVLFGFLGLVYAVLRIGFLLAPVTILENRIDLVRGWTLTQGNFWRILLIVFATVGPIVAIEVGSVFAIMGKEIAASVPPVGSSDQVMQQHALMLEAVFRRHMSQLIGIRLILAPFELGLSVSASAFGYRALVPDAVAEVRA